jgi:hypothetical protein
VVAWDPVFASSCWRRRWEFISGKGVFVLDSFSGSEEGIYF